MKCTTVLLLYNCGVGELRVISNDTPSLLLFWDHKFIHTNGGDKGALSTIQGERGEKGEREGAWKLVLGMCAWLPEAPLQFIWFRFNFNLICFTFNFNLIYFISIVVHNITSSEHHNIIISYTYSSYYHICTIPMHLIWKCTTSKISFDRCNMTLAYIKAW